MVDIFIEYQGELHCRAVHEPSSAVLETDAPRDNHGRGGSFSPTDLVATGLGTCIATVLGIWARKRDVSLAGLRIHVKKSMTRTPPRRIEELAVQVTVPKDVTESVGTRRAALEHEAHTCPVRLSLLEAISVPMQFHWQSE